MDLPIYYFDLDTALHEQQLIIDRSGGLDGLREIGLLESVLEHIQNDFYYPEFEDKLTCSRIASNICESNELSSKPAAFTFCLR